MREITLEIAGRKSTLGIRRLRVQQQINDIPLAQLELNIPVDNKGATDKQVNLEVSQFALGSRVVISLDNETLFSGYLVQKKVKIKGKCWSVKLEARHALQKLTFLPRSKVFRQQDDSSLLKEVLQSFEIKLMHKTTAELSSKHDQLVQFRLSDWQFIRNRLLSTNCWLIPDAASDSVTISSLSDANQTPRALARDDDEHTLYEVNLSFDNRFMLDSLSLQGWDIATQRLTPEQKSRASAFRPWQPEVSEKQVAYRQQDFAQAFSMLPEASLKTLCDSWLNHQQMTGVQGQILLSGTGDYTPGDRLKLSGFGAGLDGTAILSGVNHLFDTQYGWRSELVIGMPALMLEPASPIRSLHIGTVVEFAADPQHLDRIAIHLPALGQPDASIFARLSKPWASHASGFCFYPEPGDEVVVGFIDSDPRYPMILGAMHNPKNTAPFPPDESNSRKGIVVSKNGNTQSLLMDTDEKTFSLADSDNSVTLTHEGGITLNTPQTLQFTADTLNQQADSALFIDAKQQVEITSAKINMKK